MRNGADAWLRQTLELLGFNAYFLLPALTVGILLGWHHVLRQPWHVRRTVLLRHDRRVSRPGRGPLAFLEVVPISLAGGDRLRSA